MTGVSVFLPILTVALENPEFLPEAKCSKFCCSAWFLIA